MRLLYIGNRIELSASGADQINRRNFLLLQQIFPGNIDILELKSQNTFLDKVLFFVAGLSYSKLNEIIHILNNNEFDYIFISHSLLGRLCKVISARVSNTMIITFFHNIEIHYAQEFLRTSGILHLPFYFAARFNEKRAVKYSDRLIVMNHREAELLDKFYNRNDCYILSTSLEDKFIKHNQINVENKNEIIYLFVGVSFFANIEGLRWFISEVFTLLTGRLIIVGKGMEVYRQEFRSDRIEVLGYVESLSELYEKASFVVSPILSGGGMKTKVAEALMYGKTVLGTSEAFTGYDIDNKSLYLCNTPLEYFNTVNSLATHVLSDAYNHHARKLFEEQYSQDVALKNMKIILDL